jgi:hypothetical protein
MSAADQPAANAPGLPGDGPWADARRVEAWAGEVRVNLIRLVAVGVFYGQHLVNVYPRQRSTGSRSRSSATT